MKTYFPEPPPTGSSSSSRYPTSREVEAVWGSILKLARPAEDDAAGRFNPRNDGPLITGSGSGMRATGRVSRVGLGISRGGAGAETGGFGATAVLCGGVAGAGNRTAPHIPQKRLVPGFSFPQRVQRNGFSCL
jgi:hypothetical protein